MTNLQKVAFIGNYLPRRCGIATFTHDLHQAALAARPALKTLVVAMTDPHHAYDYPASVDFQIREEKIGDYVRAAEFLNAARPDVVNLQHEYGIFGGEAGGDVVQLLSRLDAPVVTTLHTVLTEPTPQQRDVTRRIIELSAKLVVMSEKGRKVLLATHPEAARKIEVIAHGIPDRPFVDTHAAKAKFGFAGKTVILTFGLLSPNKGIETVIDAMPEIIASCPTAVYVVLGATHPNLLREQGEKYRERLGLRARELGIEDRVVFLNQFVEQATLLDYISMCDIYVTPYLNEAQMTSGTLAYSFGLGKAVVSTPYWHAAELLRDGRGVLVPFGDSAAIGGEIAALLADDVRRQAMSERAYLESRSMTWARTAERYLGLFETTRESAGAATAPRVALDTALREQRRLPEVRIGHLVALCDDTGILQHAVYSVADRSHGYCVDDNARALLLSNALRRNGGILLPDTVTERFASFIQHAWNPDTGRFRNFMSYDRRWLEPSGSEDSHGRTLWALADHASADVGVSRSRWAASLFRAALPVVESFTSPRAWAFTLLGLDAYCAKFREDGLGRDLRVLLADRLLAMFSTTASDDWCWFESGLAYDNPRLSQALIQTGLAVRRPDYVAAGLRSLRWLMAIQTAPAGYFRPVGTESFGANGQPPKAFDQQPVEAWAAISACLAATRAENTAEWREGARRAFAWFIGENDLKTTLINSDMGSCSDGLHPDRPNENKGAESVLSYLLGLIEIRRFERAAAASDLDPSRPMPRAAAPLSAAARPAPKGFLVPTAISQPADSAPAPGSGAGRRAALQAGR